jgi:hypothetical protein
VQAPPGASAPGSPATAGLVPALFVARTLARFAVRAAGPLLLLTAAWLAPAARAEDNPLGLSMIETPDLRLIFLSPSLDYLAPHVVRTFTNSLRWQREHFDWTPSQPVNVFLKDFSDYGNAGASPMPMNSLRVEVEPSSNAFETDPGSERMYSTMNHELVHIATGDVASPEDRFWRAFFLGKVSPQSSNPESLLYSYLTVPRFNVPRWLLEGSAVFMETWMSGGYGRAQGGYDEMVYRAMVRDDAPFYDPLGLESRGVRVDFQVGVNAYLYGTRFITWLALTYSPEKVLTWLRRDAGSLRHYTGAFEQVFGLPLDTAWQQWIADEHAFQRRNLAEVRKVPITPLHRLAAQALGSSSRTFFDAASGTLYGAFRRPGAIEYIGALDTKTGAMKKLGEIKGGVLYSVTSLAFDPAGRRLFYTADNLGWRDLVAIDIDTGQETMLLRHARIGELVFDASDRSLVGVRHDAGIASIVRIPYPYVDWNTLHVFPYGVIPTDLDISPDGHRLSGSVLEVNGDQFLRVWSLDALREGRLAQLVQFSFGQALPEGFVWSRDGQYLYGSSYFTGVSNIFRCEPATGAIEAVTNAETGLFRPVPLADGRLVVQEYTGQGFVPSTVVAAPLKDVSAIRFLGTELVDAHPIVKTWQVPPADTVDEEAIVTHRGVYDPLKQIRLLNAYPVLQGYKETAGVGYHANFGDPLGYAGIGLTAAYTPDASLPSGERTHLEVTGRYLGWNGSLSWNRSDFYDLFGPTIRSRKGFAAKVGYDLPLIYDTPRWLDLKVKLAHYNDIDTLPGDQNVGSSFTKLTTGEVGLYYTDLRRSLGAVEDEQGIAATGVTTANIAPGISTQQYRGSLDLGVALPWAHSSVWSRSSAGASGGARNNALANYYFGAFGNNRVDDGEIRRYRDYDSLPGFAIDQIAAMSFVRETVEWNLPAFIFQSAGTPDFHLTWLRPTLFATALRTDPDRADLRKNYGSIGTQVDLRFSVLHWYEMVLSAGFGAGYQGSRKVGQEWMISLKIM